jgi:hypothetical protein
LLNSTTRSSAATAIAFSARNQRFLEDFSQEMLGGRPTLGSLSPGTCGPSHEPEVPLFHLP